MSVVDNVGNKFNGDGFLSFNGQPTGTASLSSRPLGFEIPMFLNVTLGNSGNSLASLTFQVNSLVTANQVVTVVCQYQGIGVPDPATPEQETAANAYAFKSCDDNPSTTGYAKMNVGSIIPVRSLLLRVVDGGNSNPGDQTSIRLIIRERDTTNVRCALIPPINIVQVGGNGGAYTYVMGGTWNVTRTTLGCFTLQTVTSTTLPRTTPLIITPKPTSIFTNPPPVTKTEEARPAEGADPFQKYIPFLIGGGVGIVVLILLLIAMICFLRRMRIIGNQNKFWTPDGNEKGLEPNEWRERQLNLYGSDGTIFGSGETMNADYNDIYMHSYETIPMTGPSNTTSAGNPIDSTMINTKAAIALPGFLKLDYKSDVRPYRTVAEGGGGIIYEAELLEDRLRVKHNCRRVAVKLVKNPANWTEEEMRVNFQQEVSIMWSLNFHENIIKLIGYSDDPLSMVMKFYPKSLSAFVNEGSAESAYLDPTTVLRFSFHICDAMAEIHSLGIVHRDLKTPNVLVDAPENSDPIYWKAVVCDFGLARIIGDSGIKGAKTANVQGISIRYAAPEVFKRVYLDQLRGGSKPVTEGQSNNGAAENEHDSSSHSPDPDDAKRGEEEKQSDVYAYSIILYELIEKRSSWDKDTKEQIGINGPHSAINISHPIIEWKVREGQRPELGQETVNLSETDQIFRTLIDIMGQAWAHDPKM